MLRKTLFKTPIDPADDHPTPLADPESMHEAIAGSPGHAPGSDREPAPAQHASAPKQASGPTLVQRIKDKLPMLEYASRFTTMKTAPGNRDEHMGKCPSPDHEDDGPSFYVNTGKNLFHCHGCGITGNVIQLYAIMNGMEADDAKFTLGRELGVFNERVLDSAESMLSNAARRFSDQLKTKEDALSYLAGDRHLTQESIERFGIGFCWGREFMQIKEVPQQRMAIDTGLAREETGKSFMAGRIVFPVRDRSGRVVGFGGRLVPSEFRSNGPKYINSPETELFKKSELLYGAYEANSGISRSGYAVVVEGYMDVVTLHQEGVDNAVAVMGASANETSFRNLWSITKRAVFCLDADAAGQKGAMRSALAAAPTMKDGCEIAIAKLPSGMDPDEYVLQYGADAFRKLCDHGTPLSRFLMEARSAGFDLSYPEGRAAFLEEAKSVAAIFVEAPTIGEQIVAEARALNAAALVDFALQTTGLGEDLEPNVLRDAVALLQRRLNAIQASAAAKDHPVAAAAEPSRNSPKPRRSKSTVKRGLVYQSPLVARAVVRSS
jgi:DNA primase